MVLWLIKQHATDNLTKTQVTYYERRTVYKLLIEVVLLLSVSIVDSLFVYQTHVKTNYILWHELFNYSKTGFNIYCHITLFHL